MKMQKKRILLATAIVTLFALSCASMVFVDESSADGSATKEGITVSYVESESGGSLHFFFGSESKIKGDNVHVIIGYDDGSKADFGRLNLLEHSIFIEGHGHKALTVSLSQSGYTVVLTVSTSGTWYGIVVDPTVANGTISSDRYAAEPGTTVTLTATPDSGYAFIKWIVSPSVTITNNTFVMPASDVTVAAEFKEASASYCIDAKPEGSGKIIASQDFAVPGVTITLTVSPFSSEFEFKGWKDVSPSSLKITKVTETTYTFEMPAQDVKITAAFQVATPHTYSVSASPAEGGSITPSTGSASANTMVQFTVTPNAGYTVDKVVFTPSIDYTNAGNVYGFVMPSENVSVKVVFKTAQSYSVSVSAGANGKIESDCTKASEGQRVTLTLSPNSGYVFDKWTVSPSALSITKLSTNVYAFDMPAGPVSVKATFKQQTDITEEVSNGSISIRLDSDVTADSVLRLIIDSGYAKQINIPKNAKSFTVTSTVKTDGRTVDLSGKDVTLRLVYQIPEGQSVDDIMVYYVSGDGSVTERQYSSYENGYVVIKSVDGSKLSASTYTIVSEMLLPVTPGAIGVRDGANGFVEVKTGGNVTQDTTLELSIRKVSSSLKNIPSNALTYDVSLTAKNASTKVDLSDNVVTLHLDASSMDLTKTLFAYYVSDDGKNVEKMKASLTEDNDVRFVVTHCSLYVLSYEEIQPLQDDWTMLIIIGIVVIIIVLIVAVLLLSRKKTNV